MEELKNKFTVYLKFKGVEPESLNGKQLINYARHGGFREEFYYITNTDNLGEAVYRVMNNIKEVPICKCGKNLNFINYSNGYREYCSIKCMSNSDKVKEKSRKTNRLKRGTDYPLQSKQVRDKAKKTLIGRYGVDNISKSENGKKKISEARIKKFRENFLNRLFEDDRLCGKVKPMFDPASWNGIRDQYQWKCLECGIVFIDNLISGKIPVCPECMKEFSSKYEKEIADFLRNEGYKIRVNDRTIIYPKEIDILVKNLGIEVNGLYWHSELKGKDKRYHLDKMSVAEEKGIRLLQFFDDEIREKNRIVKSMILARLGQFQNKIFARKCKAVEVSTDDSKHFLEENHIQGIINSRWKYGLVYNNSLVALTTFGISRHNKQYDFELLRFCSKLNTQVIGGLSKLLNHFSSAHPGSIISYADRRYSNGDGYIASSFRFIRKSPPNYYYIINGKRESRIQFQKHILEKKLDKYDASLTEWENMQLNGYDRIWDCGNLVFVK